MAVDTFISALPSAQARLHLRTTRPDTLEQACRLAMNVESHVSLERQRAATVHLVETEVIGDEDEVPVAEVCYVGRGPQQQAPRTQSTSAPIEPRKPLQGNRGRAPPKTATDPGQQSGGQTSTEQYRPRRIFCYACGQEGHMMSACRSFEPVLNFARHQERLARQVMAQQQGRQKKAKSKPKKKGSSSVTQNSDSPKEN